MATGTVKTLVRERGFGFVQGSDGADLFFHRSGVDGAGYDHLTEGQAVEFEAEKGDKGPRAAHVRVTLPTG